MKKLVFSVSIGDCEVQTFRAGGKGGQNQNKVESGVRVIHTASGARGEARDSRTQLENKRAAFVRMAQSREFQTWARMRAMKLEPIDDVVDKMMADENLKIEVWHGGHWRIAN
jgi:protein subunit release factor B